MTTPALPYFAVEIIWARRGNRSSFNFNQRRIEICHVYLNVRISCINPNIHGDPIRIVSGRHRVVIKITRRTPPSATSS